jgi:biopolymer transport protein ExbD
MEFSSPAPRRRSEPALPMINVVFLLLIFFLMSAQIVTPPPFDVTPPEAEGGGLAAGDLVLHISAEGQLALGDAEEDGIWDALAAIEDPKSLPLLIRADAALPASRLAKVLARVSPLGFARIELATVAR